MKSNPINDCTIEDIVRMNKEFLRVSVRATSLFCTLHLEARVALGEKSQDSLHWVHLKVN